MRELYGKHLFELASFVCIMYEEAFANFYKITN